MPRINPMTTDTRDPFYLMSPVELAVWLGQMGRARILLSVGFNGIGTEATVRTIYGTARVGLITF